MLLPFLDRAGEKNRIEKVFAGKTGSLCCVYGRRRSGKSRLIQEILPGRHSVYFVADERESSLQRASLASAIADSGEIPGFDQVIYPDWDSLFTRLWSDTPSSLVLVLDEFPFLVKSSPELPSILQKFIDRRTGPVIHLLICGSSQRMMQGLVLDASAPLYGRAKEILHIRPLDPRWISKALKLSNPVMCLEAFSVWGGVPRYWELASDYRTLWKAVDDLVLDPLGVLHHEPHRLLLDDLRETAQTSSILSLIGQGCQRMSEIAGRLGKPATSLTRPLQRLIDLGFIRREQPFGVSVKKGKKSFYRIDDPLLAFWFRYVDPNRSSLAAGAVKQISRVIKKDFASYCGATWERLVQQQIVHIAFEGIDWLPGQRWWGTGTDRKPFEVDFVAESSDRNILLVGESRFKVSKSGLIRIKKELDTRIKRLPFAGNYEHVIPVVFLVDLQHLSKPDKQIISGEDIFSL